MKGLKTKFSETKVRTLIVIGWTKFHVARYSLQALHTLPSWYSMKEKFLWMTNLYSCRCEYFSLHIKGWRMQRIAKETWSKHLKTCTWCTQVGVIDFNINFFFVFVCVKVLGCFLFCRVFMLWFCISLGYTGDLTVAMEPAEDLRPLSVDSLLSGECYWEWFDYRWSE